MSVVFYDTLVDSIRPGDRVELTGVYKAKGIRPQANKRTTRVVFATYLEGIAVRKLDKRLTGEDTSSLYATIDPSENEHAPEFSEDDLSLFQLVASRHDVVDYLVNSIAPSIFGNNDVKEGLLCQLVGGVSKEIASLNNARLRGEINVLLVGDPGTAKSQLLDFVHRLSPRGLFTSGKGSSSVGLTAFVTKDPDTGETVLESGALVLSDLGICCIDEFDKMAEGSRTILHEALEQQTISVAKAGIVCSLNARTSVIAAANPIESRYNHQLSVVENINIPPTLLSRFDLIYLILDIPDKDLDARLAKHVVSLFCSEELRSMNEEEPDVLPLKILAKYIAYVRSNARPEISMDAAALMTEKYLELRSLGSTANTVTATPRQLESLIRISEAYAKIRLASFVEDYDVERAFNLVQSALKQAATDPRSGLIDLDKILTGQSAYDREALRELQELVKTVLMERDEWRFQELFRVIAERHSGLITHAKLDEIVKAMDGQTLSWRDGVIRRLE
ncbi:hypothetical protein GEMRC1_006091 [Eukaryota sp. GEM-RC1]